MQDGDAVAESFGVRENVGGKENGFAFLLELHHQVANFAASHGIEARHGLIQKDNFWIVQDGLSNACALQHPLGKFP